VLRKIAAMACGKCSEIVAPPSTVFWNCA